MFCPNCGNPIPDNTKFCNHCGAQQPTSGSTNYAPGTTTNQQAPANAPKQQPQKAPKKKANIFIILAVFVVLFLIGKFVIAPSMAPDTGTEPSTNNQGSQAQLPTENNGGESTSQPNPAYEALLTDAYIVHFQTFFGMETKSFAMKQEDGIICCSDYGYQDDVVKQWVETVYVPVSEYTDSQKAEVESGMKAQFAALDALSCCTVSYKMGAAYFTITCTYSDVDKAENYAELYNAGILQTNTFVSMSATEGALLSQGFVKK